MGVVIAHVEVTTFTQMLKLLCWESDSIYYAFGMLQLHSKSSRHMKKLLYNLGHASSYSVSFRALSVNEVY